METYHKINAPFKRDMLGEVTGIKGKLIIGDWALPEFEYLADNIWEHTEKVDGTNIRVGLHRLGGATYVEFGGRTDNARIPAPLLAALGKQFPGDGWVNEDRTVHGRWMAQHDLNKVVLYGEGYGPKIEGGGKYVKEHSFVLFDVKIGDFWLDRVNVNDVAEKLGIGSVPVIGRGTLWDAIDIVKQGLPSAWNSLQEFEAEGIVARPIVPLFNRKGERIITKIKAKDFR